MVATIRTDPLRGRGADAGRRWIDARGCPGCGAVDPQSAGRPLTCLEGLGRRSADPRPGAGRHRGHESGAPTTAAASPTTAACQAIDAAGPAAADAGSPADAA